jgi:VCBS repeat-containing protein
MLLSTRLLKPSYTKLITFLLVTLQLSACSSEEFLAAVAPDVGSSSSTINEANRPAIISGVDTGSIIEDVDPDGDNLLEVSGKLIISDSDAGEEAFIAKTVNGNYGDFDIDNAGNWSYAANNQQAAIQNLGSNATLTESQTVSSIDGTTHTVEITIIGIIDSNVPNNPAVITGTDRGSVTEDFDPNGDDLLDVNGTLNISDIDAGEAAFIMASINGNYGNLNIDISGNWTYGAFNNLPAIQNLNTGASLTDNLIISSVDGTTHNITITINGVDDVNQPAIITGVDTGRVTEDVDPDGDNLLEAGGKLNISDSDDGEAAFIATTFNGSVGSLTIDSTGNWNYSANNNLTAIQALNNGAILTENIVIRSIDGTSHNIVITIEGADDSVSTSTVRLSWVAPSEREDNTSISLSEIAGYTVSYGTTMGQYPNKVTINDGTAVGYTFLDFPAGTYHFVVTTIDTEGRESQHSSVATVVN